MNRVVAFLRLAASKGWRPTWQIGVAVGGLTVIGAGAFVVSADPVWLIVALLLAMLLVLLVGAFFAWDEADRRAVAAEPKANRTDLLEARLTEVAKELAVSQAQYKVLSDFRWTT
jgi:hypothetical protein